MVLDENGWTTVKSARVLRDRLSTGACHFAGFAKVMGRRRVAVGDAASVGTDAGCVGHELSGRLNRNIRKVEVGVPDIDR